MFIQWERASEASADYVRDERDKRADTTAV